jgi:hypothetical protein
MCSECANKLTIRDFKLSPCSNCNFLSFVVSPRRPCNLDSRRFGTLCRFHPHRQVDEEWLRTECEVYLYRKGINTPYTRSSIIPHPPAYEDGTRQRVPKRRLSTLHGRRGLNTKDNKLQTDDTLYVSLHIFILKNYCNWSNSTKPSAPNYVVHDLPEFSWPWPEAWRISRYRT